MAHHGHGEHSHENDVLGRQVGILASVLAVLLAIVTIASHRTHTEAIIEKSTANDNWSYYQATKLKLHNLELGETLLVAIAASKELPAKALEINKKDQTKYDEKAKDIMHEAKEAEAKSSSAERRALRYDIGEGLLEIGLVLSSLYFIARKKMFPIVGITAGLTGTVIAMTGYFVQ